MAKPRIAFLVNGDPTSAMAIRAQSFAQLLADVFDIEISYRAGDKISAIWQFCRRLALRRPALCYVFDMAFSGVLAAGLHRLTSLCPIVIDTGDAIYELSRSTGERGPFGLALTRVLEWTGFAIADQIVVRSHPHQELLQFQGISADVLPDGVDTDQFRPCPALDLREKYHLDGSTVIGVLGTIVWSPRWQMCYGWELIEVIHRLKDRPVKGVIIGDGSGLPRLKARAQELGVQDRIVFLGRVPYDELPRFVSLIDICLSTQTNDKPGQVRTTGKLPIYLACGRFVLSSEVGEAARVLPENMLVPYNGTKDPEYPRRLAERIATLLDDPDQLREGSAAAPKIARQHFDYRVLAPRLRETMERVLARREARSQSEQASPHAAASASKVADLKRNEQL